MNTALVWLLFIQGSAGTVVAHAQFPSEKACVNVAASYMDKARILRFSYTCIQAEVLK